MLVLFAKGAALGLTIALPVGPIALRLVQLTLSRGLRVGTAAAFGVALADTLYGAVAAFGLAGVAELLVGAQDGMRLAGAAILLWMAWTTWRAAAAPAAAGATAAGRLDGFASTFVLTLTNPLTILGFAGAFAAIGLAAAASPAAAAAVTAGVFVGSAGYQLLICGVAALLGRRMEGRGLAWTNRIAALLLAAYAAAALFALAD